LNAGTSLTKNGTGTLVISAVSPISGNLTINQGTVVLRVNGALPNIGSITIAAGASLVLDNASGNDSLGKSVSDRVKNTANVTLNGGNFTLIGGTTGPVNEVLGNLILGAGTDSSVTQIGNAAQTTTIRLRRFSGRLPLSMPRRTRRPRRIAS